MENLTTEQHRQMKSPEGSALQGSREQETIDLKITDFLGTPVTLRPKVELYSVYDFMGREMPGLALDLYQVDAESGELEPYATLTKCFGEFISIPNSAYIDTNNCPFAEQLLEQGIAKQTSFSKESGYCRYPLWVFKEEFLRKIGGKNYQSYIRAYQEYGLFGSLHNDEKPDMAGGEQDQPASKEAPNQSHKRKEPER